MGTDFQLCKMKSVPETNGDNGCIKKIHIKNTTRLVNFTEKTTEKQYGTGT